MKLRSRRMSASGLAYPLILFLFFILIQANGAAPENGTADMVPLIEGAETAMLFNESRRRLGSFQICALCTCCGGGGGKGYCLPSPCCYAINCNIPNRPFGFCSFTPKACNCFGCHL
ncbi:uncharacterized protein LOC127786812 [Diospyros lotus]|uniref:uncharacterized protein LOC127786812 n=1 Tax=Diospyros lotus TaxID=55363 RepID=UPI002254706F|nr:uncharacterized protein LOC127786812 [Diospyros lotus]